MARTAVLLGLSALAASAATVALVRSRAGRRAALATLTGPAKAVTRANTDSRANADSRATVESRANPAGRRLDGASALLAAAGRRLDGASALLAASVLADSAIEHYRGSFHNKAMYVPLGVSALTLAVSLQDGAGRPGPLVRRDVVNAAAVATGMIGTGFHLYNITKRPGGFVWLNLFYAAPLGAPAALSLAGLLGAAGQHVRMDDGLVKGPLLAGLVSVALLGTAAEAGLLHFRGAYHNPAMVIPITAPPIAAILLARAALSPQSQRAAARWSLRLLTGVGVVGSAFHAYGIQRSMGGWRNWSQNLLNGPPLPAPPSFTALAIAGLAALRLIEEG
ncbi:MAG: hypothetical protein ACREEZ_02585 [Stellaceae bacterium]